MIEVSFESEDEIYKACGLLWYAALVPLIPIKQQTVLCQEMTVALLEKHRWGHSCCSVSFSN